MSGMSLSHEFPCNNCGAKLHYDAETETMKCKYCDTQQTIPQHGWDIPIEEGIKIASRGFGTPVSQLLCNDCGATVNVARGEQTVKCAFCGSVKVLAREASGNPITPKAIVPFKIDKTSASSKFSKWLGSLWFRPNDLKHMAKVQEMDGVYIPFWVFNALANSDWLAEAGYHYYETEWEINQNGDRVATRVEKTRWESVRGSRQDYFDGTLVCASKGLPPDLVEKLKTFDTHKLTPYRPEFLAGWQAESYVVELMPAWEKAQKDMGKIQNNRCEGDVPGDEHAHLHVRNKFSHVIFKHVLLPIWISTYRYHDKPYQFLVNGQTGEIVGKAPWSFWKIAGTILTVGLSIAALIANASRR